LTDRTKRPIISPSAPAPPANGWGQTVSAKNATALERLKEFGFEPGDTVALHDGSIWSVEGICTGTLNDDFPAVYLRTFMQPTAPVVCAADIRVPLHVDMEQWDRLLAMPEKKRTALLADSWARVWSAKHPELVREAA
jgi:hypothetical protein